MILVKIQCVRISVNRKISNFMNLRVHQIHRYNYIHTKYKILLQKNSNFYVIRLLEWIKNYIYCI